MKTVVYIVTINVLRGLILRKPTATDIFEALPNAMSCFLNSLFVCIAAFCTVYWNNSRNFNFERVSCNLPGIQEDTHGVTSNCMGSGNKHWTNSQENSLFTRKGEHELNFALKFRHKC